MPDRHPNIAILNTSNSPNARLKPVSLQAVQLEDAFWAPRMKINQQVSIPAQYHFLEETGRLDNFRRAAGEKDISFQGFFFNDSDVYKWLEAASWALAAGDDPDLVEKVNTTISLIAEAQQPDGYLNTYFTFERANERWTNLKDLHELYCAGHLIQAAIANRRATGHNDLFEIAVRLADHIGNTFGPGKRPRTPGHPEIEMALVELARESGRREYLELARFLLDNRGKGIIGGSPYHLDHQPLREMQRLTGHAVRAGYLCAGATDIYIETGEPVLGSALVRLWENMVTRQMYISGGIGSRYEGEAFGEDYELPNARAYTETCAAIANLMWNWRMLQLEGDCRYADVMELALYNGILAGVSLDGMSYFYVNPLANNGSHKRQTWYACACCPPNIARILASLPGYFYSTSPEGVWFHLYTNGRVELPLTDGQVISIKQNTRYPWDGDITLEIQESGTYSLFLRIPGWIGRENTASVSINGQPFGNKPTPGSYLELKRSWQPGDKINLHLPMPVRLVESHPYALENTGRVAMMRGPLLYCLEGVDNPGCDLRDISIKRESEFSATYEPDLLGGVVTLRCHAFDTLPDKVWQRSLYRPFLPGIPSLSSSPYNLMAIPYYAWANREPSPMQVWIRHS